MLRRSESEAMAIAITKLKDFGRVSIPDAARILRITAATLRLYCQQGKIDHIRINGRPWITQAEIQRFLREGTLSPEAAYDKGIFQRSKTQD